MMHLLPQADVPVVQVALPVGGAGSGVCDGRCLVQPAQPGRAGGGLGQHDAQPGGILAVGTSPPRMCWSSAPGSEGRLGPWRDLKALLNYRSQAPHACRPPTDDHFLPFFFALGAAGDDRANYLSREVMYSMLAMDAFRWSLVHCHKLWFPHLARLAWLTFSARGDWICRFATDLFATPATATAPHPWLLVLMHGVGSNEQDLFSLAPQIPDRFHVLSLRGAVSHGAGFACVV